MKSQLYTVKYDALFTVNSLKISFHLIVSQEVSWFEGEQQGHVIVQGVLTMDIISFVLQQPARLIHHPIRRMDRNHRLSQVVFNVDCYV